MSLANKLMDTRPLRSSVPFRNLWIASTLGAVGIQIATVAVLQQVWEMTRSPFWTGMIGISTALPILVLAFLGGSLADRIDRRALVLVTTGGQLVTALMLAAQAILNADSVLLVLVLVSAQAGCGALGAPAKRTFPVRLLARSELAAGLALQNIAFQASMLAGPAVAGLLLAKWGFDAAFGAQALAYVVALVGFTRLPKISAAITPRTVESKETSAGLWLILRRPVLWGSFATDIAATVLAMPVALFPLINEERFDGDPRVLGLFLTSMAIGGIGVGLFSGTVTNLRRSGVVQLAAAASWGLALAAFGLSGSMLVSFVCLAIAGAADTVSVVTRGAAVQLSTPDTYRGRVASIEHIVGVAGPEVGNFRAGLLGGLTSASGAVIVGGLVATACVGLVAATNRPLRQYEISSEIDRQ